MAEQHCESLLNMLVWSQQAVVLAKDRKAQPAARAVVPKGTEDAELADLILRTLVQRTIIRLGLGKVSEEEAADLAARTAEPWLAHLRRANSNASQAHEDLFRFYHSLAKAPESVTGAGYCAYSAY